MKEDVDGVLTNNLKTIKLQDDSTTYVFPKEYQGEQSHIELKQISLIKTAYKSMTKDGQYRNVNITLPDEIKRCYIDEQNNFIFKGFLLEEQPIESLNASKNSESDDEKDRLDKIIDIETNNETNIMLNIEKNFNINKFNGIQQNAIEWLKSFETECKRHKVSNDNLKIQIMSFFLEANAKDWYRNNQIKIHDNNWSKWTHSFKLVYAKKGWTEINYAYKYKYINGSLIDYSLKKEKLLLEAEPSISEESKINHIVINLPENVQNNLDKEELNNTDELMNILRKYDMQYSNNNNKNLNKYELQYTHDKNTEMSKKIQNSKYVIKSPCYKCVKLGYQNRYHPIAICRNKNLYKEKFEIHLNENIPESNLNENTKNDQSPTKLIH